MTASTRLKDDWSKRVEEASRWHADFQNDDVSPAQWDDFLAWQADPQNEEAYEAVERALEALDHSPFAPSAIVADVPPQRSRNRLAGWRPVRAPVRWIASGAAAAAILIAASVIAIQMPFGPQTVTYRTDIGEQRTIALDDGSSVTLNTASTIEVAYSKEERFVSLTEGQALFDVTTNRDRPFTVATGTSTTTALGTSFDVYAQGAQTSVTLLEGSVIVEPRGAGADNRAKSPEVAAPRAEPVTLSPGEKVVMSESAPPVVSKVNPETVSNWRDGVVQFTDAPLSEIVAELNRYSKLRIEIQDDDLASEKLSGTFPAGEPETFLSTLELYAPLRRFRIGNTIYISRR